MEKGVASTLTTENSSQSEAIRSTSAQDKHISRPAREEHGTAQARAGDVVRRADAANARSETIKVSVLQYKGGIITIAREAHDPALIISRIDAGGCGASTHKAAGSVQYEVCRTGRYTENCKC
jgi:hypothetical protein